MLPYRCIVSLLLITSIRLGAVDLNYLIDTSDFEIGFIESGQSGDFYIRTSLEKFDPVDDNVIDGSNSVLLGNYIFDSSLIVSPEDFSLGPLLSTLTNGVDEYIQIFINAGSTTIFLEKLESEWFSTPTDLIGQSIVSSTFRIDEVNTANYIITSPPAELAVYRVNATVTIETIPELACTVSVMGLSIMGYATVKRRRKAVFASSPI